MTTTIIELDTGADAAATAAPTVEGIYTHITDHVAQGLELLIERFRQPRIQAMLSVMLEHVQDLEDVAWDVNTAFDVTTAVGDQLDLLGAAVGELRQDRLDAAFRAAILTRIAVNRSEGKLEELLTILTTADAGLTVVAREAYPAAVLFRWASTFAGLTPGQIMQLIQQSKPAGVNIQAVIQNTTTGFRWSTAAAAGGATTRAFASVALGDGGDLELVVD